jgi:L-lactate utilization protein LutC
VENEVLLNIRKAIDSGPISQTRHSDFDVKQARLIPANLQTADKISLFKQRAESSGSKVHLVDDINYLKTTVKNIIPENSVIAVGFKNGFEKGLSASISEILPDSCKLTEATKPTKEMFNIDVAITDVDLAIAETGSIALSPAPQRAQLISLTPTIHIALIRPEQIVSDLMDWSGGLTSAIRNSPLRGKLPSGFNLISGPRPAELHLVVVKGTNFNS